MTFEYSNNSFFVDLCVHLHLVIREKFKHIQESISAIKSNRTKKVVSFLWSQLNFIIVPHIDFKKYDEKNADDNKYVAFYAIFILLPIAIIIINPIQLATSSVIDKWIAHCVYVGDFKSYKSHELYSIVNDRIKHALPAMIRSFFVIIGIGVLLYFVSEDVLLWINEHVDAVAKNILSANSLIKDNLIKNNQFLMELERRITSDKEYRLDYIKLNDDGKEEYKTDTIVQFFKDSYSTFTRPGSLAIEKEDSLRQKLSGYSSDFRFRLFTIAIATFFAVFLVFLIEEIYLPHTVDNKDSNMAAFLDLTETFKNSFKHNFLRNFEDSRSVSSKMSIIDLFKYIINLIIESRVVLIIVGIFILIKVMLDNVFGDFISVIKKNFSGLRVFNASRADFICGELDLVPEKRIQIIDKSEDLVIKMISPAIIEASNILLDCCTDLIDINGKDTQTIDNTPIIDDIVASGVARFANDFKDNFNRPIFEKIFGGIYGVFNDFYKYLKGGIQIGDKLIDYLGKDKVIDAFGDSCVNEIPTLIMNLCNLFVGTVDIPFVKFISNVIRVLQRLMYSKFKELKTQEDVNGVIDDFKKRMRSNLDKNQLSKELIDKMIKIVGPDKNADQSLLNEYVVYNILELNMDHKGVMSDEINKLFYSKSVLPSGKYFDVFGDFVNIGEQLILLIYSNINGTSCNEYIQNIIKHILSMIHNSTIVIYNAKKIRDGSLTTKNFGEHAKKQKSYVDEFSKKFSIIYGDSQDLFNKLSQADNLQKIIEDISLRVGILTGLCFSVVFFFILFKPSFVAYNSVQDVLLIIKVPNDHIMFFDESNVLRADMIIIDFRNGINIGSENGIGSYNTLAKGLQLFIDFRDNNVGFFYINNGIMRKVSLDDNLFVSIIGDSGSGKSVILNLLSLSNLKLLQNSVNMGEIRCCLTLKDLSKVNVSVSCVDIKLIQKYLNLLAMKQDQPYDANEFVSTIIDKYSGNTALENLLSLPAVEINDIFTKCGKSILSDLGIWEIYSTKIQRKISEISGGQRQRFGIAAMFANMLGNAIDFDIAGSLLKVYGKLSSDNLLAADMDYCNNVIKNMMYRSFIYDDAILNAYQKQLQEISIKLSEMKNNDDNTYYINYVKNILMNIMISIEDRDGSVVNGKSGSIIKSYVFDESLSALNNAVKDNVMKFIRDLFGVNKRKYPTISNAIAFMVEHGSISVKYADMIIVCFLEDSNNSAALCGTFYEVLNDSRVPIVFKSQILEARLEEILSSTDVSEFDKDSILNIYKKIQSGKIVNDDWKMLPRILLLDTPKSNVIHTDLFAQYLNSFTYLDPMYDIQSRYIKLIEIPNVNII
jgi:ABC-type phosphate transport system ATPase subunit